MSASSCHCKPVKFHCSNYKCPFLTPVLMGWGISWWSTKSICVSARLYQRCLWNWKQPVELGRSLEKLCVVEWSRRRRKWFKSFWKATSYTNFTSLSNFSNILSILLLFRYFLSYLFCSETDLILCGLGSNSFINDQTASSFLML